MRKFLLFSFLFLSFFYFKSDANAQAVLTTTINLPSGGYPIQAAVDSANHLVYVITEGVNYLYVINSQSDTLIQTVPLTVKPHAIALSNGYIYIANYDDNSVSVFNAQNYNLVTKLIGFSNPVAIASDNNTDRVYVTNDQGGGTAPSTATIVDSTTNSIIGSFSVGPQPRGIAVNPVTNRIYITSAMNNPGLTVIDGDTNTTIATISLAGSVNNIAVDTSLNRIFVNYQFAGEVYSIDGNTNTIITEIPVHTQYALNPVGLIVDSGFHKGYTGNLSDSNIGASVSIFDTDTNSVLQQLSVGSGGSGYMVLMLGLDAVLHKVYAPLYSQSAVAVITEPDIAPTINLISNASINEGDTYSTTGSFTDSDSTSWTATVDYGDGSVVQPLVFSGQNFTLNHQYLNTGTYTLTVTVTDNQGLSSSSTAAITVNNSIPVVGAITAPTSPVQVNTSISTSANFIDQGTLDMHTAFWDWGDGTTNAGMVSESNGSGSVTGSHTYTSAGVYTVTLTVSDEDGASGSNLFQYVVVYDPSAGFVTGGGNFTSPAGALVSDPSATGKVIFGFNSKYTSDSTSPTGSTMFNFNVGSFNFSSNNYSWLVVSPPKAQLKGTGTVNGSGNYTFFLTVIDGSLSGTENESIRMQVLNSNNNVIYDNQSGAPSNADPATVINGGNIIIHQ